MSLKSFWICNNRALQDIEDRLIFVRTEYIMAFTCKTQKEIMEYCSKHLPRDSWYAKEFNFIQDDQLRKRIIQEFKATRFAYKLYEGIAAEDENLIFEVRNQILAYASIYEAIIENVLTTYYQNTKEYDDLMHHTIPVEIGIPAEKKEKLKKELEHDGKKIVPFYYKRRKKDKSHVRFEDKCETAKKLGIIHCFTNNEGVYINLPEEIKEIYSFRNGIHLIAEQRKGIQYELGLSKKAYRRMNPFVAQIKEKLIEDRVYNSNQSR